MKEEEFDYAEQFLQDWIKDCQTPPEEPEEYEMSDEEFQIWMDEMNASAEASHEADRLEAEEERRRACL